MLFSCSETPKREGGQMGFNHDAMAKELCICLEPLYALSEELRSIPPEGESERQQELLDRLDGVAMESERCAKALEEKYGYQEGNTADSLEVAFERTCPATYQLLDQFEDEPEFE